ncbi:UrcA family protein [Aurantiacibacter rhizosphaerae]|uniref:UrcA family protein n=1 Tax=Aurantiacibacter rhizosphaerae TaxID=2691582 RepID=A0A844X7M3_9SPHN|nr:UrcA family protein [Aurantiacibacter rhizosphaerae]MWV26361.1 UrcA family protein [Aurantiacibacter rhizosphaerae]
MRSTSFTHLLNAGALVLASASLAFAPAVSAKETVDRQTSITHADLDLSTQEGVEELERRIDRAAKDVCGFNEVEVGTRARTREGRQCYRDAKRQLDRQFAQLVNEAQRGG